MGPAPQAPPAGPGPDGPRWLLLVYRVPSDSSRARVAVWRDLKRLGGLYLQQMVCLLPARPDVSDAVARVREKITDLGGSHHYFELPALPEAQEAELRRGFLEMSAKDYAEIVEECETKFVKEIEFERFRANFTFEESEEIRQDLEKLRRWYDRVLARDWFGAPGRQEAADWVARCQRLLEEFEEEVYARTGGGG